MYCTVLYSTVLYYTVLYCTVLYCTVLYCTILYCTVLYCTALLRFSSSVTDFALTSKMCSLFYTNLIQLSILLWYFVSISSIFEILCRFKFLPDDYFLPHWTLLDERTVIPESPSPPPVPFSALPLISPNSNGSVGCFSAGFDGRLGNLMFEYAAVVGICVFHHFPIEQCISIKSEYLTSTHLHLPFVLFKDTFNLQYTVAESSSCHINSDSYPVGTAYDPKVLSQPSKTFFAGYMQSWKYFTPHAVNKVQQLL